MYMNRNVLKIIAVISMFIDHLGLIFFDNLIWLRLIGRIAFPIFAFFIAEGMRYTKNRKKYVLTLLLFAVISQIPYMFLFGFFKLNILFTFLYAILFIYIVEIKNIAVDKVLKIFILMILGLIVCLLSYLGVIDYGSLGVSLVLVFYFIKGPILRYMAGVLVLVLMVAEDLLLYGFSASNFAQLVAIISIVLLFFYNGEKGRVNLKYFFYVFYPAHLYIMWLVLLIV